jgi:hypothetical protein
VNQFADVFERRQFGRITYYAIKVPGFDEMPAEQRPMNPFVAVFDKHLFVGSSTNLFERIVAAHQGEIERLADSQEYARMTDTLRANTAGVRPAALMMSRPELSWHFWYDLLTLDSTRVTIEEAAADNEVVERFAAILREGGLPPFEVLKPYIGPGGGILYDTNDGFHGVSFSLRGE